MQPTVHTDIRNRKKQSRVRMMLAGGGLAGALLIGGLFGGTHSTQATAHHTLAQKAKTSVVASHKVATSHKAVAGHKAVASHKAAATQVQTAPTSYTMANDYVGMARQDAIAAGINPDAFVRQIQQESGFNPSAGSPAGAVGIAQFMPGTAASMGVNPYDPSSALSGAAHMMAGLAAQYGGDYAKALAAYNAGGGAVDSAVVAGGGNWLAFMPAETQNYVAIIMG